MIRLFYCLPLLLSGPVFGYSFQELANYGREEREMAKIVLQAPYNDPNQRPPGLTRMQDPVDIEVSAYITELSFCDKYQSLMVSGYLRQFWTDPRLVTDSKSPRKMIYQFPDMFRDRKIWVPDTFVVESAKGFLREASGGENGRTFLRMHSDGYVKSSMHFNVKAACPVDSNTSAGQKITCKLTFESYGYNTNDLQYFWTETENLDVRAVGETAKTQLKYAGWQLLTLEAKNATSTVGSNSYTAAQFIFNLEKL